MGKKQIRGRSKCLDNFALFFGQRSLPEDVGHRNYSIQWSPHLVAYVCEETSLCLIRVVCLLALFLDPLCQTSDIEWKHGHCNEESCANCDVLRPERRQVEDQRKAGQTKSLREVQVHAAVSKAIAKSYE